MKRVVLAAALAVSTVAAAPAADEPNPLAAALYNLAIAQVCLSHSGEGHLAAARSAAVISGRLMGMSETDAVLAVDQTAREFANDPRAKDFKLSRQHCMQMVLGAQDKLEVETARFKKANAIP